MIIKLIEKIPLGSYKIFFDLITSNKKSFIYLIFLSVFQIIVLSLSIVSVIPLADFIVDQQLINPNRITKYILIYMDKFEIPQNLTFFLSLFLLITVFRAVLEIFITKQIYSLRYELEKKLFTNFSKRIFETEWNFFFKHTSGTLLNIYTYVINQICAGFTAIAIQVSMVIRLSAFLIVPTLINYKMTIFAASLAVLILIPLKIFTKKSYVLGKENLDANNIFLKNLSETFQSIKLILGFNKTSYVLKQNQEYYSNVLKYGLKTSLLSVIVTNSFHPIGLSVAAITFAVFFDQANDLSILAAVFWSLLSAVPVLQNIIQGNLEIASLASNYEKFKSIILESDKMKFKNGNKTFEGIKDSIKFNNVTFGYEKSKIIINDSSFNLPKNQTYLISGYSGVGKSTLIDLIMRYQKPLSGNITVNNINIDQFDINSYRSKIGYVPQEPFLYSGTILDNIYWANPNISEEEINNIFEISNCKRFIENLPNGINTNVGERGNMLSGGQKQRVALARALAVFPEILILDEATNSLDLESSISIRSSLQSIKNKMTILIISHETDFFKSVDKVLEIKEGKIKFD